MYMYFLDKSVPPPVTRWLLTLVFAIIHGYRVFYILPGFGFPLTYLIGHYIINSFFKFLKPSDGTKLAIKVSDDDDEEFKPFIRKLPEFKLWRNVTVAVLIAFVMSLFPVFDDIIKPMTPCEMKTFWIVNFLHDMVWQLADMIKYKYIPITLGKKVSNEYFKPFMHKLPDFQFWGDVTVAVLMTFVITFFLVLVGIMAPGQVILFWIVFFVECMIFQLPITFGNKKDGGKKHATGLLKQKHDAEEPYDAVRLTLKHLDLAKKLKCATVEFAAIWLRLTLKKYVAKESYDPAAIGLMQKCVDNAGTVLKCSAEELAFVQLMMQKHLSKEHDALQEHVDFLLKTQKSCEKELAALRLMIQEHGCKEDEHVVAPSDTCAVDGRNERLF